RLPLPAGERVGVRGRRGRNTTVRVLLRRVPAPCAHLVGRRVSRGGAEARRGGIQRGNPIPCLFRLTPCPPRLRVRHPSDSWSSRCLCGSQRLCVKSGREAEGYGGRTGRRQDTSAGAI